ncbi:MAG: DUF896 domain-containing protein [Eubacteriales bacterium]|nr:DUF896 domain-containing protein [Eubacteriales bacterium]
MEKQKIDRINVLARKSKSEGLTPEEKAEQKQLRDEYIAEYRANLKAQLDNTVVVDPDGNRRSLKRKPYNGLRRH